MAWRDQYRPGSWRGVPFVTEDHTAEVGRRGETHEFPGRDAPWREDLGRAARRWQLRLFVIGPDYMAQRDALITALERKGPGQLIHPFLGALQAELIEPARLSESTAEGGIARFDCVFGEPGSAIGADETPDTQAASRAAAKQATANARDRADKAVKTAKKPPRVAAAVAKVAAKIAGAAADALALLAPVSDVLRAGYDAVRLLQGAQALLAIPFGLADQVSALVASIVDLGGDPLRAVRALTAIDASATALPVPPRATPTQSLIADNQQAVQDLVTACVAAGLAQIAANAAFGSYDDAIAFRDQLAELLDARALAAADRGNDALAADLDALRRAIVADITARGGSLERLFSVTPARVEPALVIAWRLYRDPARTVDQAADLVTRNRVRHPSFVPAARLAMLTAGGANG